MKRRTARLRLLFQHIVQLSAKSDSCFTAKNRRLSVHHSLTIAKGDTVTLENRLGGTSQ